ncbi:MAM and LDL-receptor class A domain-containing protein 1-like [Acropora millepora]|uniref:MAM and LDL-receptor class A domain-containing protein 1-like n=1 Tax=Acropora millepora TaxID=45264 RepID=UPI001CF2C604|nr:MAM and LDL-receptor class A domain-containing protein 1-like [Acropora millepora]
MFLEIGIQQSQNLTIQVSLHNKQSYARLTFGISKNGLEAASLLAGWNVILVNKSCNSLHLQWMDIKYWLNGGVRFFVVAAKNSYSSVPIRKLFSPNITSAEITGLDPYTVYNVSVVVIYANGSPFKSTVLQARTDTEVCGFEDGLCRGWHQSYADDFDWRRHSGDTWPYNTGPSSGHGGYGFYMYIQTSRRFYGGDKAKLLFSPPNSIIGKMSCLRFYYHMYGATVNRLNVFNGNSMVFTKSGEQGNRWLYAEMTVLVRNKITFEGITGASYAGVIAIDDVLLTDEFCKGCMEALNDSFGHLNITYNERFSPDCIWTLENSGISKLVAIDEVQLSYCSGLIKVLDGVRTQVFSREGCLSNHTSSMFLEIAIQQSQNLAIQVSLHNKQSYARLTFGISKDGLEAASLLAGWNVTLVNKSCSSLHLQWMDVKYWLNGGVRFFVVAAKNSYSSVPIRKLFSPNITSAEITGLDPYTVYNVSVVVIDGNRSAFKSTVLQARTDTEDCGYVQSNTLRSPGYPSHYPNNMDCVYRVPIPIDKNLWIFFSYFSLEDNKNCTRDYLKISDGSNRRIGTYCGHQTGRSVDVVGRTAVLKFVSNRIVRYQGFTLSLMFTPKVCGFEDGLCHGWYQSYADDFDWERRSGATWPYNTGPSSGHGGYGYYMYIQTWRGSFGDKAKLLFSPPNSVIGAMSCLKFYYHMYGATVNRLNVFNGNSMVFTKSGEQGNRWLYAEMTVLVRNKITFEGVSYTQSGVIAIDDVSLTDGFCKGCMEALNDSFGHLNITYNERFSPDCIWTLENSGISELVAIVSIDEVQLGYCSSFIKVFDGIRTQVFSREGCLSTHTSGMFLEIAIQESQNLAIQVSLHNKQSYARLTFGISKNGLEAASLLAGWNVILVNKSGNSLRLQWMDVKYWLNGGVRFFIVAAKNSYSSVPIRKLFSPNITSAEITGLDPYTVYNVSVVVIDGNGSPFKSTVLQARTDTEVCGFEDGLCRGWHQSYNDDFEWTRHRGSTSSTGTGPSSGHGGYGFYMYIETSRRPYVEKKAKLLFLPPSSIIGKMSCLKFYYHMHGATINRLNVFNGNSMVFTKSGQQGNRWLHAEMTVLVRNKITFEGIKGASYTGDIAIDDVSLTDGFCQDCGYVQNNTLRSPRYPSHYPNNMDCVYRVPIPIDKDLWIFFSYFSLEDNKNCTRDYLKISDGSNRRIGTYCGHQTGRSVRVDGRTAVLKFVSNRMVRYQGFILSLMFTPKVCGFEDGLCLGWYQSYADDLDWTRHRGSTSSSNTGPSSGHGGFYMYIEAPWWPYIEKKAKLLFLPPSSIIGKMSCLKFYYHVYGATINRLNVFNGYSMLFTKSGQQGNGWLYAEMTVFVRNKITFEGITGPSYIGVIAIDDVSLTDGFCQGKDHSVD